MEATKPSRTALGAAMHRALHQTKEGGAIFSDPLAVQILDDESRAALEKEEDDIGRRGMRRFIAFRSRFAEDRMAAAIERGTRQIVIVGAGLDTFALRNENAALSVYEVDHPATQGWKRARIAAAGLAPPGNLHFAPVNFETETLADGLARAGFDPSKPAYFMWLGVVPYLTEAAIFRTLDYIAHCRGGEVVFDYANPREQLPPELREILASHAARVDALGEPWITFFDTADLHARLKSMSAVDIEDAGPAVWGGSDFAALFGDKGGHVVRARWR